MTDAERIAQLTAAHERTKAELETARGDIKAMLCWRDCTCETRKVASERDAAQADHERTKAELKESLLGEERMGKVADAAQKVADASYEMLKNALAKLASVETRVRYYVDYPDTRCGKEGCVTMQQLRDWLSK